MPADVPAPGRAGPRLPLVPRAARAAAGRARRGRLDGADAPLQAQPAAAARGLGAAPVAAAARRAGPGGAHRAAAAAAVAARRGGGLRVRGLPRAVRARARGDRQRALDRADAPVPPQPAAARARALVRPGAPRAGGRARGARRNRTHEAASFKQSRRDRF